MPRRPTDTDNSEDLMSDAAYEDWETVSESFGTKLEWNVGSKFVGVFTGVREVKLDDDENPDGFSMVDAAEFTKDSEKFYCWLPFALKDAITEGRLKAGQTVYIHCTGEEQTKRGLNPVKVFDIKVKPS